MHISDLPRQQQQQIDSNNPYEQYILQQIFKNWQSRIPSFEKWYSEGNIDRAAHLLVIALTAKELQLAKGQVKLRNPGLTWSELFKQLFLTDPTSETRIASFSDLNRILMNSCLMNGKANPDHVVLINNLSLYLAHTFAHVNSAFAGFNHAGPFNELYV